MHILNNKFQRIANFDQVIQDFVQVIFWRNFEFEEFQDIDPEFLNNTRYLHILQTTKFVANVFLVFLQPLSLWPTFWEPISTRDQNIFKVLSNKLRKNFIKAGECMRNYGALPISQILHIQVFVFYYTILNAFYMLPHVFNCMYIFLWPKIHV